MASRQHFRVYRGSLEVKWVYGIWRSGDIDQAWQMAKKRTSLLPSERNDSLLRVLDMD